MKQGTNNEIDLLLRRIGGRDGGATREAQAADDGHLDVDELSSYAQNALPAAARARYTEHLAECATCRKLVTELSLTLGTVAVAEPVEAAPVPGVLKKFLASLFSPLVLRYAVPALGVIVVMVVGFVVLRQQRRHEMLARMNEQPEQSIPGSAASPSPSQGSYEQPAGAPEQVESHNAKPNETKSKPDSSEASGTAETRPATAPAQAVKDRRSVAGLQSVAPAPTPAAPAKAAPSEVAVSVTASVDSIATKQPEQVRAKADAEVAKERANEPARSEIRIAPAERQEQEKPKAAPSQNSGFLGGAAVASSRPGVARRTADTKREDEKSGEANQANEETRTIAGRRFRKARGIWTDTAYDSSTATVNMARDSEQFRALIADEPAIGTIAKQLDGELIVVWKGRAYRIR
jgi:hypothetical protein